MALRSSPNEGIGFSPFEIFSSGYRMALPVDMAKMTTFDQEHPTPQDVIKEMRTNLDHMNKIIRTNILENQQEMKLIFDEKVTPYSYTIGSVVLLNNPVEKV